MREPRQSEALLPSRTAAVRLLAGHTSTAPKLTANLTATPACGAAREATAADVQNERDLRYGRRRTPRGQLRYDYGSET